MSMHFFNNEEKGLKRVKIKTVTLPEEDIERSRKRLSLQKRDWGQKQAWGCGGRRSPSPCQPPTPALLPGPLRLWGLSSGKTGRGKSWRNLACGIDINVAEGGAGGSADY